jgi:hypothetical protein
VVARPAGALKLENAVNEQQPGLLSSIGSMLGTPQQSSMLDQGLGSLSSLLGGNTTSALAGALSRYAGIGDANGKSLLGLLAPVVMGVLGQQSSNGRGIAQILESQKDNIARAVPSGFANYLSGTGILDELPGAITSQASRARPAYGAENPSRSWILPVLGTLALLGLGWYLISRPAPEKTVASRTDTETQMRTPGAPAFTVAEADVGKWMNKPVFSSDNKKVGEIAELARGPGDMVTDVYLDGETSLGIGTQRYHITADKIREVKPDGLVLTLTEADVKAMPPAADRPASQPSP